MTRTTFFRLTILQSSHRRLTDALTFMVGFWWAVKWVVLGSARFSDHSSRSLSEDKKSRWHEDHPALFAVPGVFFKTPGGDKKTG
jgi:hypothetical protein